MAENRVTRKVAAILAADAVGFTRLMAEDEPATMEALDAARAVFIEHIEANQGRVVDTAGDSVLAVFEITEGAVLASVAIQERLAEINEPVPDERRMRFRIGLHLGDIREKADGTVFGDGVNVAARLQSIAEPGAIIVSDAVQVVLKGRLDVGFADAGTHEVKNVAEPVHAYRVLEPGAETPRTSTWRGTRRRMAAGLASVVVLIAGFGAWQGGLFGDVFVESTQPAMAFSPVLPSGPSIAVLPFENLSGNPDQDFLSDGLTADVIAALGRFSNLSVMARNATLSFAGQTMTPQQIGQALGVRYLLDGSVRMRESRIRINVQLIDARNGLHLWSNQYDREYEDVFAVQDDITRHVAGTLAAALTHLEEDRAVAKATDDLDAYELAQRGWALMRQETRQATFEAREVFREAATLDPEYAAAYAGIAETYSLAADRGWTEFVRDSIENAESLARQALTLDPDAVEARRALANVYRQKGEHDKAAAQLRLALDTNPSDAESYKYYGFILLWSGHAEKAIEWLDAALRLDPKMEAWAWADLGQAYYLVGRYDDAVAAANQAIDRRPGLWQGPIVLVAAQAQLGNGTEAIEAAKLLLQVRPFFTVDAFIATIVDPDDAAHMADGLLKAGLPQSPTRQ